MSAESHQGADGAFDSIGTRVFIADSVVLPEQLRAIYRVESCLSERDDRSVYRLRAIGGVSCVIMKRAHGPNVRRLRVEYETLLRVSSAYVPKVIDFVCGSETDDAYLLREYIEGTSLYDYIESRGALSEDEAICACESVCLILRMLHEMAPPIIVNDIKPQNIIHRVDGSYALIDLDAASVGGAGYSHAITPETAAPEQFGYQPSGPSSDVYGVGMLLLYLLTGDTRIDPAHIALAPLASRAILRKCLAFDPKKRYRSADALMKALRKRSRPARRIRRLTVAALILSLAVGFTVHKQITKARVVSFREPLVERAAHAALGIPDSDAITHEMLASIEQIGICGDRVFRWWEEHHQYAQWHFVRDASGEMTPSSANGGVMVLDDLAMMPNLSTLIIDQQNITDLTPLYGLPLQRVSLCANHNITDLTPFSRSDMIRSLRIEDNRIVSLEPIAGCAKLTELDVGSNPLLSIQPIAALPIERLFVLNVSLPQLTDLSRMPRLRELRVTEMPAYTLASLSHSNSLTLLAIQIGEFDSFEPFANIPNLRELQLGTTRVADLGSVGLLTNVTALTLNYITADNLSMLGSLVQLESLGLEYPHIADISSLSLMPNLRDIYTDRQTAARIGKELPDLTASIHISEYTE